MCWATSPFFSIINGTNTRFVHPSLIGKHVEDSSDSLGTRGVLEHSPAFVSPHLLAMESQSRRQSPRHLLLNVYMFVWCATVHMRAPCSLCSVASDWFWRVESWRSAGPSQEARDHGAAAAFTFSSFLSLCTLTNLSPPSSYTSPTFQSNFFLGYGHPPPLTGLLICNSDIYCRPKWAAVLQVVGGDSDVGQ